MKKLFALVLTALLVIAMLAFPALSETVEAVTDAPAPVPAFTVDLTQIITDIIGLLMSFLLAWIARIIVPPARKWLEARTTAQQRDMLNGIINQLVLAAEQIIGSGNGKKKMDYVCEQLRLRGYSVDIPAIEACVKEMNDSFLHEILYADEAADDE